MKRNPVDLICLARIIASRVGLVFAFLIGTLAGLFVRAPQTAAAAPEPTLAPVEYFIPCRINLNHNWSVVAQKKTVQQLLDDINNNGRKGHSNKPAVDFNTNTWNRGSRTYGICETSTVRAARSGEVARVLPGNGVVYVYHPDVKQYSEYRHLRAIDVSVGQQVIAGITRIGLQGENGCPGCGIHLHFVVANSIPNPKSGYSETTDFTPAANWKFVNFPNDTLPYIVTVPNVKIYAQSTGRTSLVWDVNGASKSNNAFINQWGYNNSSNQKWMLKPLGGVDSGYINIVSWNSGKCAVVEGASLNQGARLVQYDCNSSNNGKWRLIRFPNNTYALQNMHSELFADLAGASLKFGAWIVQWNASGSSVPGNQRWYLNAP